MPKLPPLDAQDLLRRLHERGRTHLTELGARAVILVLALGWLLMRSR